MERNKKKEIRSQASTKGDNIYIYIYIYISKEVRGVTGGQNLWPIHGEYNTIVVQNLLVLFFFILIPGKEFEKIT